MRRLFSVALSVASPLVFAGPILAQQYSGTYTVANDVGGVMTLTLQERRDGTVIGKLSSNGITYRVEGRLEDGAAVGVMRGSEGTLFFDADRWENELWVTLYGTDAQGQPNYDDATEIDFVAEGAAVSDGVPAQQPGGGNPLAGGATDPYVGTFTDGNVTLQLQGTGGQYQGQLAVGGEVYPVSASGGPTGLQGVIQAPDGPYGLTIQSANGGLFVVSGGQQYQLAPQSAVAAQGAAGADRTGTGRELAPGFTENHPLVQEWVQFLSGNKLTRMSSYSSGSAGGYSARTDVYLCSDRTFAMRDESSVSVDVGGAFGNSGGVGGDQGQWYVISNGQAVGLILESNSGQTQEFRMEYQNQETYANGERVYVTPAEVCL